MGVCTLIAVLTVCVIVEAVPVVFKESTPNGEAIVSISSSDPDLEKYWTQQLATRSGFTQLKEIDETKDIPYKKSNGVVHSSYSIASPGKAVASSGRSFASASSGPFPPLFAFPYTPEGFGYSDFDLDNWMRNFESFYNPNFPGNGQVSASATAISDGSGRFYGKVDTVTYDNKAKSVTFDNKNKATKNEENKAKSKP